MKYQAFYKSITWRVVATSVTAASSFLVTGDFKAAASILSIDFVTKSILYFYHEKIWERRQ